MSDRVDTTISIRSDVWSGTRDLDTIAGVGQLSAWGRFKVNLGLAGGIIGNGWIKGRVDGAGEAFNGLLRELYWRYDHGDVELKVGRQMVVWGRADGVNPTDNLSPRDFTLLVPEDGDLRHGNETMELRVNAGRLGNFSGLFFPQAASHKIPLPRSPNVYFSVQAPQQSQWALKWETHWKGVDGSLSYFEGVDPMPDLNLAYLKGDSLTIAVRNHRVKVFGGDFSLTRDGIVWRGEAAWMQTDSSGGDDFVHKKPQALLVGGPEWTIGGDTTLGFQGVFQYVKDYQSPNAISDSALRLVAKTQVAFSNQVESVQGGFTWRLARRWWNDTLLSEVSGEVLWPTGSGVWRTKVDYSINDHWNVQGGSDHYFGSRESLFGLLTGNSLVYIQVRYSL